MGAVFFMVVVALLSVAITRSVSTGADAFALELMSNRAFLAAETGAQLGVRSVYPAQGVGVCAAQSLDLTSLNLLRCTANVQCRSVSVSGQDYFSIESTGRCTDGGAIVAERVIFVRAQS